MQERRRIPAAAIALAFLAGCETTPFPPPEAHVEPIVVDAGSAQRIAFRGVAYEIEAGALIGTFHFRSTSQRPFDEARWAGMSNPFQFNTIAERCLEEAGYDVHPTGERMLSPGDGSGAELTMSVLVTRIWVQTVVNRSVRKRNFQEGTVEGVVRVHEASGALLYERPLTGWGRHEGINPSALGPAFENLFEHALADADFVAAVRAAPSGG